MKKVSYKGYRLPPEIFQAIWLYLRFTLSFRDVEDLLAERDMLKMTRKMLAAASRATKEICGSSIRDKASGLIVPRIRKSTKAITTFTVGPATATASSCAGFSGIREMRATPPTPPTSTSGEAERERIKRQTITNRRLPHRQQAA
jgi:DNA-binding IclR family transcriptional regulator